MRMMALILVLAASYGCGGPQRNKVLADTDILPYVAPDVEELSGADDDDDVVDADEAPAPEAAPAQNPQK